MSLIRTSRDRTPQSHMESPGHSRIALLLDNIESDYQIEMIRGVLRATRASNVNVVIAPGGRVASDGVASERNFLFDFIRTAEVDGLMAVSGSLSNHCGIDAFGGWLLEHFPNLPTISVGIKMPNFPSVSVDNASGMYAVISHLIEDHGKRHIACFRGPLHNQDAQERFAAYEQAMRQHNLPIDQRLVCPGDTFGREDGHLAVETLLSQRGLTIQDIDAIACVNDDTALGAMEALTLRGVAIPTQIAVVGFDDAPNARAGNPPLTTVNQLVEEQGYSAATNLLASLSNGTPISSTKLNPTPVLRGSCGCRIPMSNDSSAESAPDSLRGRSPALELLGKRTRWAAQLARAAAGRLQSQPGWEEKLLRATGEELDGSEGALLHELEAIARRSIAVGGNIDACNDVLTRLRLLLLSVLGPKSEPRARVDDMLQETRLRLTEVALGAYREREQASANHLRNLTRACLDTLASHNGQSLTRALREHLPALGICACTVSRLQQGKSGSEELKVVARLSLDLEQVRIEPQSVASLGLGQNLKHRAVVVLQPLVFNGLPVGLAGFSWGAHNPLDYEQLRELFSVAAYGCGGGTTQNAPPTGRQPSLAGAAVAS